MTDRREEREAYNARERAVDRLESDPGAVASAFKEVFDHPKAPIVLAWFLDTCRATETTLDENPLVMAAAEGRRQAARGEEAAASRERVGLCAGGRAWRRHGRDEGRPRRASVGWGDA